MTLLSLSSISKHFGSVEALTDVELKIEPGEVVALAGDNGAGKSTLAKIIAGTISPSSGVLSFEDNPLRFTSPIEARELGIEIVYQDLALCNNLSVAANIFLGRELVRRVGPFAFLDQSLMEQEAERLLKELSSETPAGAYVGNLSGGQRQAVAIARVLYGEAKLLILDEPTAAISVRQVEEVLELILKLRQRGIALILITHRIPDIFQVCTRVIVLRRGRKVGDRAVSSSSPEEVTSLITGAIDQI